MLKKMCVSKDTQGVVLKSGVRRWMAAWLIIFTMAASLGSMLMVQPVYAATVIKDAYYQIKYAGNTKYVLDIYGASKGDCANLQICHNHGGTNQGFAIVRQSDGYYKIIAIHSNKVLDVEKGGRLSGTNIIQYRDNGGSNQRWQIIKNSDGTYSFKSKCNNLYMDVRGAQARDEVNVWCYTRNNSAAQKFYLQEITVNGKPYGGSEQTESKRANALYDKAKSQLGQKERSSGSDDIKYNDWYYGRRVKNSYSAQYAWCAVFVSWCADQAGIPTSIIPKDCNTRSMKNMLVSNGGTQHLKGSGYKPVHGDIIFFGNNAGDHVGIVDYTKGNTIYFIDGNNTQTNPHGVHYSSTSINNSWYWGSVTPNYSK